MCHPLATARSSVTRSFSLGSRRKHKAWGVSPRKRKRRCHHSPRSGRRRRRHEYVCSTPVALKISPLPLAPRASIHRGLLTWGLRPRLYAAAGSAGWLKHYSLDSLRRSSAVLTRSPRLSSTLVSPSPCTNRCSPLFISLIATSARPRSSSPTIATNGMPRAEAYLNCLPILTASGYRSTRKPFLLNSVASAIDSPTESSLQILTITSAADETDSARNLSRSLITTMIRS